MSWLLTAPILLPFAAGIALYVLPLRPAARAWLSVGASALLTVVGVVLLAEVWTNGPLAAQMGAWPAPFGITLIADLLSAVMVLITGIVGLAVAVYAVVDIDSARAENGYHALFQFLLGGVGGAFVTGDLFNLYVWFEVMLIASFALLVLGATRPQMDGGVKYVALNLISTVFFLTAIALTYGLTGTLNLADLGAKMPEVENQGLVTAVAVMLLVAFGIKSAAFPLFFWLPASYHTPPVAVSAVFAALLTKVGVYALIRVFTLVFDEISLARDILLVSAAFTMLCGVLGAAAQNEFRRILSFHIVSQIGYMLLGLALFTPLALAGAVFYLVHHIIVKANLFLISGAARYLGGSFQLSQLGGLYQHKPFLAVLFLIPAFSLAGFPPLSGFWAKLVIIRASLADEAYILAAAALLTGLLTVYSMIKIWTEAFLRPGEAHAEAALRGKRAPVVMLTPIIALAVLTLLIGLQPAPLFDLAERSAAELLDPSAYSAAVLGAIETARAAP